ncbi:MAG: hypothetical protein IPN94_16110 [Sphingobacteriales bacterium]|nr:hypothetical protein [Sphingobacteriales bacterium]
MKNFLVSEEQQPSRNSKWLLLMIFFFVLFAVGGEQKVFGQLAINITQPNATQPTLGVGLGIKYLSIQWWFCSTSRVLG